MKPLILASNSPRRKKFFEDLFGENFKIHPSNFDESTIKEKNPVKLAKKLALLKAREVSKNYDNAIIVAADSFVVYKNKILGKPKDEKDAFEMLKMQNSKKTKVITGLAVIDVSLINGKRTEKEFLTHDIT